MAAVLAPEMAEHTRRWRSPGSSSEWQSNVQYLRNYATRRPDFARQHLVRQFGLRGTANLTLSVSNPDAGHGRLNTLDIAAGPGAPWTGVYFRGNPIRLTALPHAGHRFVGWDGLPGVQTNVVSLLLNGDLTLRARFEVDEAARPIVRVLRGSEPELIRLQVAGPPGSSCRLESTTDFATWSGVTTLLLDERGAAAWQSDVTPGVSRCFYRAALP
jgi:hypothetical protein